jgi:hypothetical protein
MIEELEIVLTEEMLSSQININFPSKCIYVDRSNVGILSERKHNLIGFSKREKYVAEFVVQLASKGFFLVSSFDGKSKFEKFTSAENFKSYVKVKNLKIYNNLYYTLANSSLSFSNKRLIVVFSSVADRAFNADISVRNFFTNFETISKYIPQNTYVLRISDIGGIIGNFYMNTVFSNTIEEDIQGLLNFILQSNNINKEDVVLYGSSKGATSALYHGILGGYKCIAVDPIVSDEYHEIESGDSHFTKEYGKYRIYPQSKQDKFRNLMKTTAITSDINIIYSQNSPIYGAINNIIKEHDLEKKIKYLNVCHPKIKTHPDVAPKTINILMLVLNNLFYGLGEIQSKNIDCQELKVTAELKLTSLILETNIRPSYLRVYTENLKEYQDIELKEESTKVTLFKLKGKALSIICAGKEYGIEVDVNKNSILSKIVSYKEVERDSESFSYLVIN